VSVPENEILSGNPAGPGAEARRYKVPIGKEKVVRTANPTSRLVALVDRGSTR